MFRRPGLGAATWLAALLRLAMAQPAGTGAVGAILPLSGLFSTLGPPERDARCGWRPARPSRC